MVQRAQGGPDELYEVGMIWEEGVVPERSERFSARTDMRCSAYLFLCARWSILGVTTRRKTVLSAWSPCDQGRWPRSANWLSMICSNSASG